MAERGSRGDLAKELSDKGYVVIPDILSPSQLSSLREAAARTTSLARCGKWKHTRTVGKQFPPWDSGSEKGIWGVQALMNPQLPDHKAFTALYFSDQVLGVSKELMQCGDDDLVMELLNMLVRPDEQFELRWHRDDIGPNATAEEELERLGKPSWHTQWNLALYDDDSLIVVPGSHQRARTETERRAGPYENPLPGQITVSLKAGDIAFYNNNILHRGVYDATRERMTVHGSVGHIKGERERARNVLQHGVADWVDQCDFSDLEPERVRSRAEGMRTRLVTMGNQWENKTEYSLEG